MDAFKRASSACRKYVSNLREKNEHNGFMGPIHGTAYDQEGRLHRQVHSRPIDHGQSLLCVQDNHPTHLNSILQHGDQQPGGLYGTKDLSAHFRAHAPLPNPSCGASIGNYLDEVERVRNGPPRYP